jgi:type IV pilus assembly protein PilF
MDYNPEDTALLNNYGVFLCGEKKYQKANEYFNKVLDDPVYQRKDLVYENMGICAQSQGNLLLAEKYLNKAISLNPRLPAATLTLAQMSFDKQQFKQAKFYYDRYLELAQHTSQSLWLGYLLEKQVGNKNQAASYAILLKGKFPDSRETKLLRKLENQ